VDYPHEQRRVMDEGKIGRISTGNSDLGVRPTVYVNLNLLNIGSGSGSVDNPYQLLPTGSAYVAPVPAVQEEPVVEEKPVTIENEEPSMAPLVDFVSEPEPAVESKPEPEVVSESESESVIEESVELEATEEEAPEEGEVEVEESSFNWKKWLIPAVFCIIVFAGGYLFGLFVKGQKEVVPEKVEKKTVADVNKSAADMKKSETDMKKPVAEEPGVLQKEDVAVETEQKTEAVLDKYEEMDIRVRTGAYRILGLDHMEKIKKGDNLTRICKRTIGVGMECYLEVFNGIKPDTELKAGDEIKIPKLELKKKKSQKPL
jgi:hypothetical protein